MLNKDEELGLFEILKINFPNLNGKGLVISVNEFLSPEMNLQNHICKSGTVKEAALPYMLEKIPYIILDESEGYQCIFFRGNFLKIQYDVTNHKTIRITEEVESTV
ncbi:MAG: hypothetical protein H7328_00785 [Bdellovibrio sp.]|nr:hypothetical protein [Bdellovibrio sp.]